MTHEIVDHATNQVQTVSGAQIDYPGPANEQHPDDVAVDRFAVAMKAKLKWEREERGRSGWQEMSAEELSRILFEHLPKRDPVDVANLCMMLSLNGQDILCKFHPDVLAVHAEFGGDLNAMQALYDRPDHLTRIAELEAENERLEIVKREAVAGWKDAERALSERAEGRQEAAAAGSYYTKGKDAEHFAGLPDKDFAWALTCAAQDLNDSDENVSEWMPVTALLFDAADRIERLTHPAAVTEATVEAVVQAVRPYTMRTLFIDEHRELVRAALKRAEQP